MSEDGPADDELAELEQKHIAAREAQSNVVAYKRRINELKYELQRAEELAEEKWNEYKELEEEL